MKFSMLTKKLTQSVKQVAVTSAIAVGLAVSVLDSPASAQQEVDPVPGTTETQVVEEEDGFDWGLLGLLGLLGLAGLARKQDDRPTAYQDPRTTTTRTDSTNLR